MISSLLARLVHHRLGEWLRRLVDGRVGGDLAPVDYETLIRMVLLAHEALDLDLLIDEVAAGAMRQEIRNGAWVSDVGIWGPIIFRREAAAAVRRMIGRSLALGYEGAPIAMPVLTADLSA
ncbi:MAG TPA: hypothetical protein VKY56_06265 [Chloroflexota bacterium]|nr:hypothetical protein [Chloroflexota bacterium]